MREAVYQRARAALARQLTAVEPPLSTREIQAQHQELEDAVARLEADYAPADERTPQHAAEPPREADYFYAPPAAPAPTLRTPTPVNAAPGQAYDRADGRYESDDDDDDEDDFEEEERASRTPLLIGLLLLILVIGGAGAYAYAERDRLFAFFDFSGSATADDPPAQPTAQAGAGPEVAEVDKRPDRLTNGPDTPPPEPAAAAPAEPQPLTLPAETEPPAAPLPAEAEPGLGAEQQTAALDPPGQSIVQQRAIYYYQGAAGTPGQATNGTVTWAQTTRESGPAVQATLRLENQAVTATVTIYKNNDTSLPASHLVEVQFSGQIGPTPVQRVPALVIKQTEQARGQPLAGAAVPVTNELFWIALSDDQEQVSRNLQLLREGSWFDIPILFNDGTRALLTFEKGIPGDKAFETALAAWVPG